MDSLRLDGGMSSPFISVLADITAQAWQLAVQDAAPAPSAAAAAQQAAGGASPAAMGSMADRQKMAAMMVRPGLEATAEDTKTVTDHLAQTMPLSEMQKLSGNGVHIVVTRTDVSHDDPLMASQHPRGYGAGDTWQGRPGTYRAERQAVIIATQDGPHGSREMPGPATSSSADVLHEAGHALNRVLPRSDRSDGEAFKAAYDADGQMKGELASRISIKPIPAPRATKRMPSNTEFLRQPGELKQEAPHLYQFWEEKFAQ